YTRWLPSMPAGRTRVNAMADIVCLCWPCMLLIRWCKVFSADCFGGTVWGMSDHRTRMRRYLELETKALLLEAERGRVFDHRGNRGSEAEESIRRWLRRRFEPQYTMSSGELVDSFDTHADKDSRQQDGLLHRNDGDANRFILPSGMRLVPVESVA